MNTPSMDLTLSAQPQDGLGREGIADKPLRIVKLDDLDPDMRRVVLALINAHKVSCRIAEGCPTCHGVSAKEAS